MAADTEAAFRVLGASKRLGPRNVLDGVDFAVRPGEKVALIGPSGAGKTTLLRLLAGVLWPTAGRVESLGFDTATLRGRRLRALRRRIGFLYQSDNLIPGLRVAHNVAMGRLGTAGPWRSVSDLVWPSRLAELRAALAAVELEDHLWSLPGTLSGGEQQRVALARLLVQKPAAILADEPVSALDERLGRDLMDRLLALSTEHGAALVVSLHDLSLVDGQFDRVLGLKEGRLAWTGAPGDLDLATRATLYEAELDRGADALARHGEGRHGEGRRSGG